MCLNILFLPLIACVFSGFGARLFGPKGVSVLSILCIGLTTITCFLIFYEVAYNYTICVFEVGTWIKIDLLNVKWNFLYDSLSASIIVVISFISFLVHIYSYDYINKDPHLPRFISYLSLFTFFMLLLVSSGNFLQLFVGWEGVGICSYLLINFWFTRIQANKAAIKAILVNRVGDFGLILGIFCIYTSFDSLDYNVVFALAPSLKGGSFYFFGFFFDSLNLISFLIFVGAVGKSAILGLHTWLPDAIEGPTPVSALIHAATIVTAGVFLLARCSHLLEYAKASLSIITLVGGITALFASTTGLVQNDLKRVIAYSTCSQLGYIIFACGLSYYSVGIFHLLNHAFFKALLFLGAGSVIHGLSDEQDLRKIGGLRKILPFTYAIICIGSFSLIGLPFLSGFYSKDAILEVASSKYSIFGASAYVYGSLAAFCTSFYSLRLLYLCFLSTPNGYRPVISKAHESSFLLSFPLGLLAFPSMFSAYLLKDLYNGLGSPFWANAIYLSPFNSVEPEFLNSFFKLLPLFLSILGAIFSYVLATQFYKFYYSFKVSFFGRKFYTFLNRKWFFDKIYNDFISQSLINLSYHFTYKVVDRGLLEKLGSFGFSIFLKKTSFSVKSLHNGSFYGLALSISLGLLLLIFGFLNSNFASFLFLFLVLCFSKFNENK